MDRLWSWIKQGKTFIPLTKFYNFKTSLWIKSNTLRPVCKQTCQKSNCSINIKKHYPECVLWPYRISGCPDWLWSDLSCLQSLSGLSKVGQIQFITVGNEVGLNPHKKLESETGLQDKIPFALYLNPSSPDFLLPHPSKLRGVPNHILIVPQSGYSVSLGLRIEQGLVPPDLHCWENI